MRFNNPMDDFSWFWASEWKRQKYLREELATQAEYARQAGASQRQEAVRLRTQLEGLQGDVSTKLDALSRAFAAYLEMDSVREQLAGFPNHAQARRYAHEDLARLAAGTQPPPRDDVTGYWVVPAVAALRPDGSLDAAQVAEAYRRDEAATRQFLLVARAALGVGAELTDELAAQMAPADQDGVSTWQPFQVMLWAASLRGAFGPDALARLAPTIAPSLAQQTPQQWQESVVRAAGASRQADLRALTWLGEELAEVVEPVTSTAADTSWQMTWQAPRSAEDAEEAEESLSSEADPDAVRRSNQELLLGLAEHLISLGAAGERELLARAAQLRREVGDPLGQVGAGMAEQAVSALPAGSAPVANEVFRTATDEHASLRDRRTIWAWLAPQLRQWLTDQAEQPAPEPSQSAVGSRKELVVTSQGAVDAGAVQLAKDRLATLWAPSKASSLAVPLLIAGLLTVVAGVGLYLATQVAAWWWLTLLGAGVAFGGNHLRGARAQALQQLAAEQSRLDESIANASRLALRADNESAKAHDDLIQAARRALSLLPD